MNPDYPHNSGVHTPPTKTGQPTRATSPPEAVRLTDREQDQGWAIREFKDEHGIEFAILYQALLRPDGENGMEGAYMAHLPPTIRGLDALANILHDYCEQAAQAEA